MSDFLHIFFIFFGWLLGILSIVISIFINNKIKERSFRRYLISSTQGIRYVLIVDLFQLYLNFREIDREIFSLLQDAVQNYNGLIDQENLRRVMNEAHTEAQIVELIEGYNNLPKAEALTLCRRNADYLKIPQDRLDLLNPVEQKSIQEIIVQFDMMNEEIEHYRKLYYMSYDGSMTSKNKDILLTNLNGMQVNIAGRVRIVISALDGFLEILNENT